MGARHKDGTIQPASAGGIIAHTFNLSANMHKFIYSAHFVLHVGELSRPHKGFFI